MLRQPRQLVPFTFAKQVFRFYLLDDEFTTDASAPLVSPRTCEPGAGTLTIVDSNNKLSVASGSLTFATGGVSVGNPAAFSSSALTRLAGRTFVAAISLSGSLAQNSLRIGWGTSASTVSSGLRFAGGPGIQLFDNAAALGIGQAWAMATVYRLAHIQRGTGLFYLIKGGVYANWTLLWGSVTGTQNLYAGGEATGTQSIGTVDYFRVLDLGAPFDSDYGIAIVHTAAVSGSDYTASATLIADVTITAPGALANTAGLRFRKKGTDYWQVWFDSSGNLLLQRFASGVGQGAPVTLASGAITASGTRTIRVIADGSAMDFFTLNGSSWTKQGSTQTDSTLTANTGISPFADSGWSLGNVDAYGRTSSLYDVLDSI